MTIEESEEQKEITSQVIPGGNGRERASGNPQELKEFWRIDERQVLNPPDGLQYEISVDAFFNASHFVVMDDQGGPIHSHSYRIQVRCRSQALISQEQVVVGYYPLRERVLTIIRAYNNQQLNDLPPFERLQPTTENLTAVLYQQLERILDDLPVELMDLTVWESPTGSITFGKAKLNGHGSDNRSRP